MTYTSVYAFLCKKEFFCVRGSDRYHLFGCRLVYLGQPLYDENHQSALISFSAMRRRRQVRSIGLQHNAVQRYNLQGLEQLAVLERQHPADTEVEPQLQDLLRHLFAAVETVHDSSQ